MRKILSAFFVLFSATLWAQDSIQTIQIDTIVTIPYNRSALYNYTSLSINNLYSENLAPGTRNRITVDFDYAANSNGAPMSMVYALLFRQPISPALKGRGSNNVNDMLRLEDFMKTGLTYRHHIKRWDGEVFFSYHHRQMRNVNATKGLYDLVFYGNARFAGDTVDISNLRVQNYIYNQYTGGIRKQIDYGKMQMEFGIGLSFLQIINQQDISTRDSWIYTAEDGDTISIKYDLTFNNAREGANTFFQRNGLGASGDIHLAFMNKDKWKLSVDFSDIGYMYFRKTPVNYSAAKSIEFRGIVLPNLLNFSPQTFDTLNLDSAVRSYLPTKTNNQYNLFIPFTASIAFSKPLLNNRLVLTVGYQYRFLPGYYGYGYVKANYFMKKNMVVSVTGGGGGYSWFNLGVEFSKRWKYFDLTIGSSNLLGTLIPTHYTGTGLYLRLGSCF